MSKLPPPPRKPPAKNETCPLCGVSYDPSTGHECDDGSAAELEPEPDQAPQTAPAPKLAPEQLKSKDELAVPAPGEVLADRYEILQELSRGGMGVVYKARHRVLNNVVAMKLLLKPGSEVDQRRFLQEAQLASKVAHPNTVYISDFGVLPDGRPFLVMEYMEGPVLSSLLKKQPKRQLDILRATRIAIQIAHGMQTVHDKGIVHREVLMIDSDCLRSCGKSLQRRRNGYDIRPTDETWDNCTGETQRGSHGKAEASLWIRSSVHRHASSVRTIT